MYEWSLGIFAKKTKYHNAGGPGTVVSPNNNWTVNNVLIGECLFNVLVIPIKFIEPDASFVPLLLEGDRQ